MAQTRTAEDWFAEYLAAGGSYAVRTDTNEILLGWMLADEPDKHECQRLTNEAHSNPELAAAIRTLIRERELARMEVGA